MTGKRQDENEDMPLSADDQEVLLTEETSESSEEE